jgi:hypothetical protein
MTAPIQGGKFGKDTFEMPQLRACLRGRSYRQRLYSAERLLYPMMRVGERGEGKFKRASWDEALNLVAKKMIRIKDKYGPTALLDQSYAGASYGVLHKSDQIEGLLGRFLGMFGCRTNSWSVPSYQGTTTSSRWTFGTIEDGNEDDTFAHAKLIIMWGWNPGLHLPRRQHLLLHAHGQAERLQVRGGGPAIHRLGRGLRCLVDSDQAQHRCGDAGGHGALHLCQQPAGSGLHRQVLQGMDAGTMPEWAATVAQRPGELQGLHPGHLRRRGEDPGMGASDLRRQSPRTSRSWRICTPPPSRRP